VNRLLGRKSGDYVLKQIAVRANSLVRPYDTMGRFEGDSFLLVLPGCDDVSASVVMRRLWNALNRTTYRADEQAIRATLTIARLTVDDPSIADVQTVLGRLAVGLEEAKGMDGRGVAVRVDVSGTPTREEGTDDAEQLEPLPPLTEEEIRVAEAIAKAPGLPERAADQDRKRGASARRRGDDGLPVAGAAATAGANAPEPSAPLVFADDDDDDDARPSSRASAAPARAVVEDDDDDDDDADDDDD
ncbi:MAG: diguanylate cyclase, partial [Acidobacteriota bacterium]